MRHRAFSLVELLVVVTIIALLSAILFPVLAAAKARAGFAACTVNLGQLGTAIHLYGADHEGKLPLKNVNRLWDDYDTVHTPEGIEYALQPYGVDHRRDADPSKCPFGRYGYTTRFVFDIREEFGTTRIRAVRQVDPEASSVLAFCVHHLTGGYSRTGDGYTLKSSPLDRQGRELLLHGDGSVSTIDTRQVREFQVTFVGGEQWKEIVPFQPWSSQRFPNTDRFEVFPGETWPPKWIDLWSKP